MTENEKQRVAIFRFSVIHEFVGGAALSRRERRRLLKEKCARKWDIPFSDRTRISRSAILHKTLQRERRSARIAVSEGSIR